MYTFFMICLTIFECHLLYRITNNMLTFRFGSSYRITPFLFYLCLNLGRFILISCISDSFYAVAKIGSILLTFLIITFFYIENLLIKLIWYSVNFFINMMMDVVALFLICFLLHQSPSNVLDNFTTYVYCSIISKFLNLLLVELIVRHHNNKVVIPKTFKTELILILLLDFILIVGSILFTSRTDSFKKYLNHYIISNLTIVLFISQMTISLCYKLTNLANAEMEQRLRIQRIEMEAKLNEDLSDIINTLRSLRHDMNNHIGIMKGLVENSEYVLLQQYLHDIYSEITNANDFIFVSNQALLILLNSKISKAQQKNIEMENIIEVNEIKISDKDMCSLLGNIIDNAIEAAEKNTDNSYIKLEIKENANCCYIYCENTYSQKPNLKNGKFITFKPDSINHGIGTENIKSIVKKYNGTINYNIDELFSVHILIPYDKKPC